MLTLPAQLTQREAAALTLDLQQRLLAEPSPAVQVDASALARFDSSALAVMLQLRRDALAAGRTFAVLGLPSQLAGLAGLYGVADLLVPATAGPAP